MRQKGLVVSDKSERVYNFHRNTLLALAELLEAAGLKHPSQLRAHHVVRRISDSQVKLLSVLYPEIDEGDLLVEKYRFRIFELAWPLAQAASFPVFSVFFGSPKVFSYKSIT